jgi:hypothetical protein
MKWMELCASSGKCVRWGENSQDPFNCILKLKVETLSKFELSRMRFECSKHVEIA